MIHAATTERRAFVARAVREQVQRLAVQEREGAEAALLALQRARDAIVARLAAGGTEFDAMRARELLAAVDVEVRRLRDDLRRTFTTSGRVALDAGAQDLLEQARAVLPVAVPSRLFGVDATLLQFAEANSADLVGQITENLRSRLNIVMRGASSGAATTADVERQIGAVLSDANRDPGVFGRLAVQVERVHRTETARLYEGAKQVEERRIAQAVPYEMRVRWIATLDGRARPEHVAMHLAMIPVGEHFNFGAGETWSRVSYEQAERSGGTLGLKVTGPHDSILPARDAVNCRCTRGLARGPLKEA